MQLPQACDASPTCKKWVLPNAGFSLLKTPRVGRSQAGEPVPAPGARARGFGPALGTHDGRESGNESLPAGGCPAFVSCFSSGGEDMVGPERLGRQRRCRRVRRSGGCAHEPEPGGSAREGAGHARGEGGRTAAVGGRGRCAPTWRCLARVRLRVDVTAPGPARPGPPLWPPRAPCTEHAQSAAPRRNLWPQAEEERVAGGACAVAGGGRRGWRGRSPEVEEGPA